MEFRKGGRERGTEGGRERERERGREREGERERGRANVTNHYEFMVIPFPLFFIAVFLLPLFSTLPLMTGWPNVSVVKDIKSGDHKS